MSANQTYDPSRDDDDKLLPEWGQTGENQIIWLGLLVAALMFLMFFGLQQCRDQAESSTVGGLVGQSDQAADTVQGVIAGNEDLSNADELFAGSSWADDLADPDAGPYTVFAPQDASLAGVDVGELSDDEIDALAGYHVVEGTYLEEDLTEGTELETLGGGLIVVGANGLLNNGVQITEADNKANNGVVHIIDGVLGDAAPEPTPEPEATAEPTAEPTPEPEPEPTAVPEPAGFSLAQLASEQGFTGLVAAAATAGIDTDLADASAGPFTVFAPTNAALDEIVPKVSALGEDAVDEVVRYHVVQGKYLAADLVPGTELTTVQGETLVVADNGLINGEIAIVEQDLEADNGIMHTVEKVLIPPSIQRRLVVADLNELFQLEPIQFATDSAEIQPESFPTLDKAVEILAAAPNGSLVEVGGHTDTDGDEVYNMDLSDRRANSVMTYLVEKGVPNDYLVAKGYGETELKVDPETSPEDKQQNRRIEFKILEEG